MGESRQCCTFVVTMVFVVDLLVDVLLKALPRMRGEIRKGTTHAVNGHQGNEYGVTSSGIDQLGGIGLTTHGSIA